MAADLCAARLIQINWPCKRPARLDVLAIRPHPIAGGPGRFGAGWGLSLTSIDMAAGAMDRAVWQEHLAQTEWHVLEAEKRVARQRAIVAELEREGRRATAARGLLAAFERLLDMHLADRRRLRQELGLSD
jgi:hypothetical protein